MGINSNYLIIVLISAIKMFDLALAPFFREGKSAMLDEKKVLLLAYFDRQMVIVLTKSHGQDIFYKQRVPPFVVTRE